MSDPRGYGPRGESFAAAVYQQNGYAVLTRNFRSRFGEIDLVAERNGILHFVEVKTRSTAKYGAPQDAVTFRKKYKLYQTILHYVRTHSFSGSWVLEIFELYVENDRPKRYRAVKCDMQDVFEYYDRQGYHA